MGEGVRLALVGCGKAKNDPAEENKHKLMAARLYSSGYFRLKREFGALECDSLCILSALHGVIDPWLPITPYDHTMGDKTSEEIAEWSAGVLASVRTIAENHRDNPAREPLGEIVVLAGKPYRDPILAGLRELGEEFEFDVSSPFDGLGGLFPQQTWLKEHTDYSHRASDTYERVFADELAKRRGTDVAGSQEAA